MNNKISKLVASVSATTLLLSLVVGPALASSTAINEGVDDSSFAAANSHDNDVVNVANNNFGNILNIDVGAAVSGGNGVFDNDETHLGTGASGADVSSDNFLNHGSTYVSGGGASAYAANSEITDDSEAHANAHDNDTLSIANFNQGFIFNVSAAVAISGLNTVVDNDETSVWTGDSFATATSANSLNHNKVTVVGFGGGGATAMNSWVDDSSFAAANAHDNDTLVITNTNNAVLTNIAVGAAISGLNTVSNNDETTLTTGNSYGNAYATNNLNSNETYIKSTTSGAYASNSDITDDSEAHANAFDNDTTVVANSNTASVTNVAVGAAVSGGNTVAGNDETSVTTGDSFATSSSTNTVNSNVTTIEL